MRHAQRRPTVPFRAAWQRLNASRPGHARSAIKACLAPRAPVAHATPLPGIASHPLADPAISNALKRRADEIQAAFAAIEPTPRLKTCMHDWD
jgi:hypothetical protein